MTVLLTVLGGSSPFTASLIDSLVKAAPYLPKLEVVLFGRNSARAALVAEYAQGRLAKFGWSARPTSSLLDSVSDTSVILHQIRYGGLVARRADEMLCAHFGVPYDETLGLGALSSLLRASRLMEPIASTLARVAASAWVINLTNPLSAVTTLLTRDYGLVRTVGVCELPIMTAAAIANRLGLSYEHLSWNYAGLNHRGFIYDLTVDGEDVLPAFLRGLGSADFAGISGREIASLRAVPLKYYRLLKSKGPAEPTNRANELLAIGDAIEAELRVAPHLMPPSLARRDTSWYGAAVLPMLRALLGRFDGHIVGSFVNDGDLAWERKMVIEGSGFKLVQPSPPPRAVEAVLAPLVAHEQAVMRAARKPDRDSISDALRLDPLIAPDLVEPIAAGLLSAVSERIHSER